MAGFANDVVFANNGDFSIAGSNKGSLANGLLTNGQMWIGTTSVNAGGTHINVGNAVTANTTVPFGYSTPNITLDFHQTNLSFGSSLPSLTTGFSNILIGYPVAGVPLTSGSENTFIGYGIAQANTSSSQNVIIGNGSYALFNPGGGTNDGNIAIGYSSLGNLATGIRNISIGYNNANNYNGSESSNIIIGNDGSITESNTIRIGTQGNGTGQQDKAFMAGIIGVTVSNQQFVTIDSSTGQLGATASGGGFTPVNWSVKLSGNISNVTGDGTDYAILYDTVTFDTNSGYSAGTGLYTFPATGVYHINVLDFVFGGGVADTVFLGSLLINGATTVRLMDANPSFLGLTANGEFMSSATFLYSATAGDTMGVHIAVNGGTKNVGVAGGAQSCIFSGFRVA